MLDLQRLRAGWIHRRHHRAYFPGPGLLAQGEHPGAIFLNGAGLFALPNIPGARASSRRCRFERARVRRLPVSARFARFRRQRLNEIRGQGRFAGAIGKRPDVPALIDGLDGKIIGFARFEIAHDEFLDRARRLRFGRRHHFFGFFPGGRIDHPVGRRRSRIADVIRPDRQTLRRSGAY